MTFPLRICRTCNITPRAQGCLKNAQVKKTRKDLGGHDRKICREALNKGALFRASLIQVHHIEARIEGFVIIKAGILSVVAKDKSHFENDFSGCFACVCRITGKIPCTQSGICLLNPCLRRFSSIPFPPIGTIYVISQLIRISIRVIGYSTRGISFLLRTANGLSCQAFPAFRRYRNDSGGTVHSPHHAFR